MRKQDGGAIFAALTAFEGIPEREQPENQEREPLSDEAEPGTPNAEPKKALTQAEREALIRSVMGSLARDDGRDMTQELLDEQRAEAESKGW
ncbi:hypothetical protein BOO71_0006238 [Deinococcus marmoris]|uniref:Uncharacterized protein n=2 Tax=Deinococcus marmoris TaxID=249408 RepID=A0A1U7NZN2_9DEIO|nr:hypothetical protein BOO71_0006238 [Deinococcus marmoris]